MQPDAPEAPAHDSSTRLLHHLGSDAEARWAEAAPSVEEGRGFLAIDDSTLDQPYARKIALATRHWSGKHRELVRGINPITLLRTYGDRKIPVDYRIYSKADSRTRNDPSRELMRMARGRGFAPSRVLSDGWCASPGNLKRVRGHGWRRPTRLKANRVATPDDRASRDTGPDAGLGRHSAEPSSAIEDDHREPKRNRAAGRCQVRSGRAQRNRIGLAPRAFLRLEGHFFTTGVSGFEAKLRRSRGAARSCVQDPVFMLPKPPTASLLILSKGI